MLGRAGRAAAGRRRRRPRRRRLLGPKLGIRSGGRAGGAQGWVGLGFAIGIGTVYRGRGAQAAGFVVASE